MPDLERVIRGLECCLSVEDACLSCPYYDGDDYCDGGERPKRDALALLRAQEPRVMTLEDMEQAGRNGDAVYIETADGVHFWALAFPGIESPKDEPFNYPGGVRFNAQDVDGDIYDGDFYGMTMPDGRVHYLAWRCWTSRPTDAQREATPWL